MNNWKETTLGEIIKLNYGKSLTGVNRDKGKIPVYGSSGITGYHSNSLVDEESLIIGRKGTVGSMYKSKIPFFPIDTVYFIRKSEAKCDWNFLWYLLKFIKLDRLNFDAVIPGLNREVAYAEPIYIPEKNEEQKQIATVLSTLDDKVELLRAQNETLEKIAQGIFKEWFVDFTIGGQRLKLENGIPEGWRMGKMGEVTKICGGTTPDTKNLAYWNGDINWTSPKDLSDCKEMFLTKTKSKITKEGLAKISSGLLPTKTLLLSSRAPIGYLAITNIPVAINQGYIAFRSGGFFSNEYMYLWLKLNMDTVISSANGSTFLEISKTSFRNIRVVVPKKEVLDNFQIVIEPTFDKILVNINQIQNLSRLRDTLLPKLMSGEVDFI